MYASRSMSVISGLLIGAATITVTTASLLGQGTTSGALNVGDRAPDATLQTIDAESVDLATLYGDGPLVVTFYRGGWCPFCNRALSQWQESLSSIENARARWIAITPEKPSYTTETTSKYPGVTVLSDSTFQASKAFGLYFDLDEQTKQTYKSYGIDLAEHNANGRWSLPHPATFIIDSKGVIRFAEVHVNYQERTNPKDVIEALESIE